MFYFCTELHPMEHVVAQPSVLIVDSVHPLIPGELSAHGFRCDYRPGISREEILEIIPSFQGIILRSKITVDASFMETARQLRFIGRVGAGMEGIDETEALRRGIVCLNSPEGNRDAVGEHTLGMLLALMNHSHLADRQVREDWGKRKENRGYEVGGKTVGIIGYGNMGSAFAQRLQGFEANVIAYDKYKTGYGNKLVRESTLDELTETTDILSLHVPLTGETTGMVNASFLLRFRKPIWLINTSRGKVVRSGDLADALESGKVRGAALDVLEYEDASFERLAEQKPRDLQRLLASPKVIFTPHVAGWTVESKEKLARVLVEKIVRVWGHEGMLAG